MSTNKNKNKNHQANFAFRSTSLVVDKCEFDANVTLGKGDEFECELRLKTKTNEKQVVVSVFLKIFKSENEIGELICQNTYELKEPISKEVDQTQLKNFYEYLCYQSINHSRGVQSYLLTKQGINEFVCIPFLSQAEVGKFLSESEK
jgi:hypothetical protein